MFFIGVFGLENKQKEIRTLENIECKNCEAKTKGVLIKSYEYFHIFFIPTFRWNEKYYVVCKRCDSLYEIAKEKGKELEKGENIEIKSEDMKLIRSGKQYGRKALKKVCPHCGETVEGEYKYCPYCGIEI